MSRLFDDASSQYLEYSGAVVTAVPLTMACWFRADDATVNQDLMNITASGSGAGLNCFRLAARGAVVGDPIQAITNNAAGPAGVATTSAGFSANTWHHACAVFAGTNSRFAFLDGGNSGSDSTDRTPSGLDRTTIGAVRQLTSTVYMSGRIADAAIWNDYLTSAEIAALARGVSPAQIRPTALVAYWPLWGTHSTEIDCHPRSVDANDYDLTVSGATAANHAPVAPFSKRFWMGSRTLEVVAAGHPAMRRWAMSSGGIYRPVEIGRQGAQVI